MITVEVLLVFSDALYYFEVHFTLDNVELAGIITKEKKNANFVPACLSFSTPFWKDFEIC